MNIFYAPSDQIQETGIELNGQEAIHASKTLRYRRGDEIIVVDGRGGWYEGIVSQISPEEVWIGTTKFQQIEQSIPAVIMAMGIIKKRDRLEFAVEKAVELGVRKIMLFKGDHSVKQNIRMDRLEAIAISSMKQSLQAWLPEIRMFGSLHKMLQKFSNHRIYAAHKSGDKFSSFEIDEKGSGNLLVIGPEGDFSDKEIQLLKQENGQFISLGPNRLRTETAVLCCLGLMVI